MVIRPQLKHLGIYVSDIERMERFYTGFLGLVVTDRGNLGAARLVFLSRDAREHHQIVLVAGQPPAGGATVLNQVSLRVADLDALRHFQSRAAGHGARDVEAVTHGNAVSLYLRDPEGNRIEFYIDTPWYVSQPTRGPVDLAQPDAAVWKSIESYARSLPGFSPVEDWRRRLESRLAAS